MTMLRRRWRLLLALAGLLLVAVLLGGYAYIWHLHGSAPPPLSLTSASTDIRQRVPDGVWMSAGKGRLETVGGWITAVSLPTPNCRVRLPVPIDLTDIAANQRVDIDTRQTIRLGVVWRRSSLEIDGVAHGSPVHATYRRSSESAS